MSTPAFTMTLRDLVRNAQETGMKLRLTHIARRHDLSYDKLWRFMHGNDSSLSADDAQRLYEGLTGKPLLPVDDEF